MLPAPTSAWHVVIALALVSAGGCLRSGFAERACAGQTCSAHGVCLLSSTGEPECVCDLGFRSEGPLTCVPVDVDGDAASSDALGRDGGARDSAEDGSRDASPGDVCVDTCADAGREDAAVLEGGWFDASGAALVFEFNGPTLFDPDLVTSIATSVRWQFSDSSQASGAAISHHVAASGLQRAAAYLDDVTATVSSIAADDDNLTAFPQGIDALSGLTSLDLRQNLLAGALPDFLGDMTNLTTLDLTGNQLSGQIPVELGAMTGLQVIWLEDNQLTGSIPAELGNLTNVQVLSLERNQLSGPIPVELGSLVNLVQLHLESNQLSGPIPAVLGSLTHLEALLLTNNQLTGPIPAELGDLTNLQILYLDANQLGGQIPAELGNLASLRDLYLHSNQLTGPIPVELANLTALQFLAVESNQLTGPIPAGLGALVDARIFNLCNNQLTGSIPAELGALVNLTELHLENNQLTGVEAGAAAGWTRIGVLHLYNNLFDQAAVDALLAEIWGARLSYLASDVAVVLEIDGTNAAPSGGATDPLVTPGSGSSDADWSWNASSGCHEPLTGTAMAYDLAQDVCGLGFRRWDVTYTP